uniref:Uncharacterized protein n=1 Tax=Arundo donax TaxID=35708 RepID=A0A0A9F4K4_ARUDO
MQMLDSSS